MRAAGRGGFRRGGVPAGCSRPGAAGCCRPGAVTRRRVQVLAEHGPDRVSGRCRKHAPAAQQAQAPASTRCAPAGAPLACCSHSCRRTTRAPPPPPPTQVFEPELWSRMVSGKKYELYPKCILDHACYCEADEHCECLRGENEGRRCAARSGEESCARSAPWTARVAVQRTSAMRGQGDAGLATGTSRGPPLSGSAYQRSAARTLPRRLHLDARPPASGALPPYLGADGFGCFNSIAFPQYKQCRPIKMN